MPKVNFGVDPCLSWCIEEVQDEWEQIAILLGNSVEASEIDTKSKQAIIFPNEEDWSSTWGLRGTYEPCSNVLVNELTQSCKFLLGKE